MNPDPTRYFISTTTGALWKVEGNQAWWKQGRDDDWVNGLHVSSMENFTNPDEYIETDSTGAPLAGKSVTEDQCVFGAATEHRCPKPITWRSVSSPRIGWCDEHAQDFKEGTERVAEPAPVRGDAPECTECGRPASLMIHWPFRTEETPCCQECLDYYENRAQEEDAHNSRVVASGGMDGGNCPRPSVRPIASPAPAPDAGSDEKQLRLAAEINAAAQEAFAKGETLDRLSSLPDDFKPRYPLKIDPLIYNHLTTTFTKEDWLALAAAATDQAS